MKVILLCGEHDNHPPSLSIFMLSLRLTNGVSSVTISTYNS
jgi:hypothetical protein